MTEGRREMKRALVYKPGTELYIHRRINGWNSLTREGEELINVKGTDATGFFLVYDDREAYDREHPEMEPLVVKVEYDEDFGRTDGRRAQTG